MHNDCTPPELSDGSLCSCPEGGFAAYADTSHRAGLLTGLDGLVQAQQLLMDEVDSITHIEVVWVVHWSLSQELLL